MRRLNKNVRSDETADTTTHCTGESSRAGEAAGPVTQSSRDCADRRRALKTLGGGSVLAAGGLLPNEWVRPVIQTVLLPAHAQTSLPACEECTEITINEGTASAVENEPNVATVFVEGSIAFLPPGCVPSGSVAVRLQAYTGNNCGSSGGTLNDTVTTSAVIQSNGDWSIDGVEVGTGGQQNVQTVQVTAGYPDFESEGCTVNACIDTSESGTGN